MARPSEHDVAAAVVALRHGCVIPAHPLALTAERRLDERRQRALTRYYLDAGAGGIAVGVHTTQFELHDNGMLSDVLAISADVARAEHPGAVLVAGVQGSLHDAVAAAARAADLGYHLALLRPDLALSDRELIERAKAVGGVMPTLGFYLQPAVGGRPLDRDFWTALADVETVVGIKVAAFDPYRTLDVVEGVARAGRAGDVALYTGNDNGIVADLISTFRDGTHFVGGLLGQWAVWTRSAVTLLDDARRARAGDDETLRRLVEIAAPLTDANGAIFDVRNSFRGCIPGIHAVLMRQGLLEGGWCLDPALGLSPGQADEIDRVCATYPDLDDDDFVRGNLDRWLA